MRYSQSEKMEIIRIVEDSTLSVRRTLEELDVNRSTFYSWYSKYVQDGYDGLANKKKGPQRFWNKIPEAEKKMIVDKAIEMPEKSPRELAWHITDTEGYFISESSVYRILKSFDLITSPAFTVVSARHKFYNPTKWVNELWQMDFTYFFIKGWGWYYLASVLDDFSRYIISWKLFPTMNTNDVKEVLEKAIIATGINKVNVKMKPRLLSDNGPCFVSDELKKYLSSRHIQHIHAAPFHPQTQGKIERYHRSMKNVILLDNYFIPDDLEKEIDKFINYYNNERYHEGINNMKPVDVYNGKSKEIETLRDRIKKETMFYRKYQNLNYLYWS
jgi:putative transposase